MIKQILVAGAAVVVLGGGVAAANHYDQYKNKQTVVQVSQAQQAKEEQYKADVGKITALVQANASLNAECQKGVVAYAKLPLAIQKVVPRPVCTATTTGL